jgi:hypothetical protein
MGKNKLHFLTLITVFVLSVSVMYSQSIQLLKPEEVPEMLHGMPEDAEITSSPEIKNISDGEINLKISITPLTLVPGHLFGLCDMNSCYPPLTGTMKHQCLFL